MDKFELKEVFPTDDEPYPVCYRYTTSQFYNLNLLPHPSGWDVSLLLERFDYPREKQFDGHLFKPFAENTRAYQVSLDDQILAHLLVGYEAWNRRLRIWDICVEDEARRQGVGSFLIEHTKKIAREHHARMIVLETQSCNVPAINFYRKMGFELIGFDSAHYSNQDVESGNIRLELGLSL